MLLIVIPIIIFGGILYSLGVGILGAIAYKELIDLRRGKSNEYPNIVKYIGLIGVLYLIYSNFEKYGLLFGVSYKVLSGVILSLFIPVIFYKKKYNVDDAFYLLSSVLFIGFAFNLFISVYNYDIKYFIMLILITILTDTFAYFGGKLVGLHHFTSISPNKTIEGCIIGSIVSTFVVTMYYIKIIGNISNVVNIVFYVLLLSVVGQIGDLFFSKIKRESNVKDFSDIIPGHGGILDRLDSIIFVLICFCLIINHI